MPRLKRLLKQLRKLPKKLREKRSGNNKLPSNRKKTKKKKLLS